MMRRSRGRLCAMLFGLLSSACTISPYHVPPDLIIDPAKTPREKIDYEQRGRRETGKLGTIVAQPSVGTAAIQANGTELRFVEKFYDAYRKSYRLDTEPVPARALTRYGMTLIDTRCDLFFEQIGRGAQTGDFARRQFQSITAALIAALGLTNIGKDAITGVGIGSAFGTQSIDNYSTVYFFSPDVSAVQRLVRRAFTSLRTSLLSAEQSPRNFDDALGALRTYQNICTAHEIKRLVTEAIDEGQTIAQYGNADGPRYAAASGNALREMATLALGLDTLSPRDAAVLQMLVSGTPVVLDATKAEIDYACSILSEEVRGKVCVQAKVAVGGQSGVLVYSLIDGVPDAKAGETLRAGWATLRALGDSGYNAEVERQKAVIQSSANGYREANIERARLQIALANTQDTLEKERLQGKIVAEELKIQKATSASEIVSEQAVPVTPVTGVGVVAGTPQPQ